jgi:hypothetical protein
VTLKIDRYLGRTYVAGQYECWDLVREAWLELTGFDIGGRPRDPVAALAIWRHFRKLTGPISPSIVMMRQRRAVPHVGLFLGARVLHIGPAGVRYERLASATLGIAQIGFYGCNESS